jgi:hypothetical protein
MNRLPLTLACFLVFSLAIPPAPGHDKDAAAELGSPYYPLKVGTQWHYRVGSTHVVMRVAKHEKVGDVMCALIETSVDGKQIATEHISAGADGIFRHDFNGTKSNEPLCILKLPLAKEQTWKFDALIGKETVKGTFKSGHEDVKVGDRKYPKAVTAVTTDCKLNGNDAELKIWFAPGVGVVKQTLTMGGREIVSELTKFEPPK